MILKEVDIKRILKENPNKLLVSAAQAYTRKLLMHMKGIGLENYIERFEGFEKEDVARIRKKYTHSNKDLFARTHRPVDKVYNARGGSVYYNTSNEDALRTALRDVDHGYTVRQWIETFYRPAFHYDPMGLIMGEIDVDGTPYPTYKSVLDVYDYQPNGRNLDYIVFKVDPKIAARRVKDGAGKQYFRVIDDSLDLLVEWNGTSMRTIDRYPNYWGRVPARIISDIFDPTKGMYISPDDDVIEIADEFLNEGSVKSIFKRFFGFPQAWEFQSKCAKCAGAKYIDGKECSSCGGSGVNRSSTVADVIKLPTPTSKDQPVLTPPKGYITPDVEGWDKMTEELALLEEIIFRTYWGTTVEQQPNETATGRFIDVQPVNDRLSKFSTGAEGMETFVTDLVGSILLGQGYAGSSVSYGRRFMIETPDELWVKYQDARVKGAAISLLDDLMQEYLQSKYANDLTMFDIMKKLMRVEPLVHSTIEQVKNLVGESSTLYQQKVLFSAWKSERSEVELMSWKVVQLKQSLAEYAATNAAGTIPPPPEPVAGVHNFN
jgi:hypothetical protein